MRAIVLFLALQTVVTSLAAAATLDVMFYNVYNLFDAEKDPNKDDWTFLPSNYPGKREFCETISHDRYREECLQLDWTAESVDLKINQLKDAILASTNNKLPDLLGLCEVENGEVVGQLAHTLGYRTFAITNSPDARGIDVALLYKEDSGIKKIDIKRHTLSMRGPLVKPTRDILEVVFEVGSEKLHVFVNHWPSQSAVAEVREDVAKQLQKKIDAILLANPKANILAMGDFNVIDADYPHPLKGVLLNRNAKNTLLDAHDLFVESDAHYSIKNKMAYGTYFYPPRMEWNRLDRFFVNARLNDKKGLDIDTSSYRIQTPDLITTSQSFDNDRYYSFGTYVTGLPYRANIYATTQSEAGYSDHFPIFVKLTY